MPDTDDGPDAPVPADAMRAILKSQYHAALAMLRDAILKCPDEIWDDERHRSRCWEISYHALFFTHFYGGRDDASFVPWEHHQTECQYPDGIPGPPDPESSLPLRPETYSKEQVLDYWQCCDDMVDGAVDALDLNWEESGFYWYPIPKLEHQLVNIRHVQHHAAQLADRVRAVADVGVDWAGARRPKD